MSAFLASLNISKYKYICPHKQYDLMKCHISGIPGIRMRWDRGVIGELLAVMPACHTSGHQASLTY